MTPDELLLAFHDAHPGVTPAALAGGRLEGSGGSSYELLARLPAPGEAVLDLGCGDGYLLERLVEGGADPGCLAGIDMSAAELSAARARPHLAGVRLIEGRAQKLPFAAASFDCVLSHLAFMLMSDVGEVVAEIARVLRPGGRFAAVTGGGPGEEDDGFALFLELFRDAYDASPKIPRLGDVRARHAGGLAELMGPDAAFEPEIAESSHTLRLDGEPQAVWAALATSYEMYALDREQTAALRRRFLAGARKLAGAGGAVPCAMRLRLLVATRS